MPWHEYVNLELLKLTSHHISGCLGLIVGFWLVSLVSERIVPTGFVLVFIETCDKIVIIAGIAWLTLFVLFKLGELLVGLTKGKKLFATVVK
jgi:hypothetical protein